MLGGIALVLGAVGTVVPFLPSVPFLLLAAVFFGKGSKRLHDWFIGTKLYRKNLESFVQGKGMTMTAKLKIMLTVTVVMAIGFLMMGQAPVGRIVVAIVWILHVLCFLFVVPTLHDSDQEMPSQQEDE
jgi:uncharacterized membrane protein YbaN (DUF454 family)